MDTQTLVALSVSEKQNHIAPSNEMKPKGKPRCALKAAAVVAGHKVYQGNPCKLGHDGLRLTRSGKCLTCTSEYCKSAPNKAAQRRYYLKNRPAPKPLTIRSKTPLAVARENAARLGHQFFSFPCRRHGADAQRHTFAHGICRSCAAESRPKKREPRS